MDLKTIASYVGSALAIGFGVALIWFAPTELRGQAGTIGAGFSFVTGGLAALGVTVTVPAVREQARRAALAESAPRRTRRPAAPRGQGDMLPAED